MTTVNTQSSGRSRFLPRTFVLVTLLLLHLMHNEAAAQTALVLPDFPGQSMLIKNTLTAVNHGNITGNYTVLRDLASERFRKRNTAGDLATTFAKLRKLKLDLSPILVTTPQLTRRPTQEQQTRRIQLVGYFPTRPQAVQFNLLFQHVNGGWVIDEISLGVAPTESVVAKQRPRPSRQGVPDPRAAGRQTGYAPLPVRRR